jgi:hypothetical protein
MKKDTGKSATYLQTAEFYSFQNKYISSSCPRILHQHIRAYNYYIVFSGEMQYYLKKTGITIQGNISVK